MECETKQTGTMTMIVGCMRESVVGQELGAKLLRMVGPLGPYPHARINPRSQRRTQKCRFVKVMAVNCTQCQYIARTTRKWIDVAGLPRCPHGSPMEEVGP